MAKTSDPTENAESLAQKQRDISVSEFFLKNRHLLGFDNPRKALLTTVKEAVDNALDACEEASIAPEVSVRIVQVREKRFRVHIMDNGPGIVRAQIPRIFAKLLYGSKFHRLRMSRGQQGIGISAAGMYGQLTTGTSTHIYSRTKRTGSAHFIEVQIDTRHNKPSIIKDELVDWTPTYPSLSNREEHLTYHHGTEVIIELEAAYVRGKLSVDEFLKQCAVVNPHLQLHYSVTLLKDASGKSESGEESETSATGEDAASESNVSDQWITYVRVVKDLPVIPREIKPHPHGVELGMLIQMLKETPSRTVRAALTEDFSRISSASAAQICDRAGLSPKASPKRIAHKQVEDLYNAINATKLMRPPTDCLSPIGEVQILAGLKKEIAADFYTSVTRPPSVYRGNPFQVEVGLACARSGASEDLSADSPVRLMRFANRVPLLYMGGACAIHKATVGVNWKAYGLNQPRGSLPIGPVVLMVHIASVWVPFTSESKEAVAHYPEIVKELTFGLQECGRQLSVFLKKRQRMAEAQRKHDYMSLYIPHLALGIRQTLELSEQQENTIVDKLNDMLERTHLNV
ncbi:MAG: DNA topoisomerase VI subunit B [Verrucomicrobia bacterium]|nr:DNA topoisomerase VI subunit B [Verrucomicrobiota bacterium]